MAGQRVPLEVIQARGAKHLTKAEIQERQEREIKPITDNIVAPTYLSAKQKKEFYIIADQLKKLKKDLKMIMLLLTLIVLSTLLQDFYQDYQFGF